MTSSVVPQTTLKIPMPAGAKAPARVIDLKGGPFLVFICDQLMVDEQGNVLSARLDPNARHQLINEGTPYQAIIAPGYDK